MRRASFYIICRIGSLEPKRLSTAPLQAKLASPNLLRGGDGFDNQLARDR